MAYIRNEFLSPDFGVYLAVALHRAGHEVILYPGGEVWTSATRGEDILTAMGVASRAHLMRPLPDIDFRYLPSPPPSSGLQPATPASYSGGD